MSPNSKESPVAAKKTDNKTPFSAALETLRAAKDERDTAESESTRLYDEWAKAKDRLTIAEGAYKDAREALFTEAIRDFGS